MSYQKVVVDTGAGIDVQAELKSKADSACIRPNSLPPSGISQQFPLQRTAINRPGHLRRSITGPSLKSSHKPSSSSGAISKDFPRLHGRHHSMAISPTSSKTSSNLVQSGLISSNVDLQAQQQRQSPPKNRHHRRHSGLINPTSAPPLKIVTSNSRPGSRDSETGSGSATHSNYYTSPFQTHIEQLGKLAHALLFFLPSIFFFFQRFSLFSFPFSLLLHSF